MNKTAIRNYAVWARTALIEAVTQKAFEYEIKEGQEMVVSLDSIDGRLLSANEKEWRRNLIDEIKRKSFTQVMEEVAYTWFNRFIALRYMEVNGFIPSRVRVFTNENGEFKPDILKEAMTVEIDGIDRAKVIDLLEKQNNEELFKYLIITQCNALNQGLPYMFEKISNWTELLFPSNLLRADSIIGRMVTDIPEEDWEDAVQIIGWMYQYYNSEWLDVINEKAVISKYELPAKTQFFTTDWIVRYMVENSLGRLWIEGHPGDDLKANWEYYLEEAEQGPDVEAQLQKIREEYANIKPEDIKIIDPCMGSGHILVYAFDVLMQIYVANGYSEREAAKLILENNLFGLDIDDRAGQLAYFAVMMKARKYSRRILNSGITPNVFSIQDSSFMSDDFITFVANKDHELELDLIGIRNAFVDAKECGSLLTVPKFDYEKLYARIDELKHCFPQSIFEIGYRELGIEKLYQLVKQAELFYQKYDIAVTNPPYLGVKKYNKKLSDYASNYYKAYKYDLFSCFIVRINNMIKNSGIAAMLTQQTWLNVDSFENLRKHIIENDTLISLAHLGNNALEGGLGTAAFVFTPQFCENYITKFINLTEFDYFEKKNNLHTESLVSKKNTKIFTLLPKTVFVYNIETKIIEFFGKEKLIKEHSLPRSGLVTRNNNLFLKLWHEVEHTNIDFNCDLTDYSLKWYPHTKGGGYRKWYGNFEYVVNWKNDGYDIREFTKDANGGSVVSQECYFHEGLSWSLSTFSAKFSMRYQPKGFIFNVESPAVFDVPKSEYILGFLNSCVAEMFLDLLSDNLHYKTNDIGNAPIIFGEKQEEVKNSVLDNILLSKNDWDSFETSWDFKKHPLI